MHAFTITTKYQKNDISYSQTRKNALNISLAWHGELEYKFGIPNVSLQPTLDMYEYMCGGTQRGGSGKEVPTNE